MSNPSNRDEFKSLVLRKCGFPVIELEIDDEQVEDCIDEALKYYHEYHFLGSEKAYIPYKLTAQDITNKYVTIPDEIHYIIKILDINSSYFTNSMFGIRYQLALNDLFNISQSGLSNFQNTMKHVELLAEMFSIRPGVSYNRYTNKLKLNLNWGVDIKEDDWIVIDCYRIIDPELNAQLWTDRWLINYTSLLVRRQVGYHLMKVNIQLPGGVSYNGETIYNNANQEIEKLEEKMIRDFSNPVLPFIA